MQMHRCVDNIIKVWLHTVAGFVERGSRLYSTGVEKFLLPYNSPLPIAIAAWSSLARSIYRVDADTTVEIHAYDPTLE
jgi:hypothetical protein